MIRRECTSGKRTQVVEAEKCQRIIDVKAKYKCTNKLGGLGERAHLFRVGTCTQLHIACARVHADLQLHVLDNWIAYFEPMLFEGRQTVLGNGHLANFDSSVLRKSRSAAALCALIITRNMARSNVHLHPSLLPVENGQIAILSSLTAPFRESRFARLLLRPGPLPSLLQQYLQDLIL